MSDPALPDLAAGVDASTLGEGGMLRGRVDGEDAILVRQGDALYAVGAQCTHYHAELADGLVNGTVLHCPLHHAQFDLRSGEALAAPAFDPLPCWRVERRGTQAFVRERLVAPPRPRAGPALADIVIVGGGAAGLAAADRLRREGYDGRLTMFSADADAPVDRPNLSKDFLAGQAEADWLPLRGDDWYAERDIALRLGTRVTRLDLGARQVELDTGAPQRYDALLLATGADPVPLDVPGAAPGQVRTLRTWADSRAIVEQAQAARRALVVGASFIGLEVAASLRSRGLEVHVVAPDAVPMQRVLGEALGRFVHELHVAQGVTFHLGTTLARLDGTRATLADGRTFEADLVVAGIGVRPSIALAEQAGLALDRGVSVDAMLQTSAAGVWAAGDIARWPDPHSGERIRVEHWAVAQRQGQVAALNMLGRRQPFDATPFFWSQHYDVTIQYVGHAQAWDRIEVDGDPAKRDVAVRYVKDGRVLAVATIGREQACLRAERAIERDSMPMPAPAASTASTAGG